MQNALHYMPSPIIECSSRKLGGNVLLFTLLKLRLVVIDLYIKYSDKYFPLAH